MHIHNPKLLLKPFTIIQAMHAFSEWFPSMKTSLCSFLYAAAAAKLLQSYPTLCDPLDSSPPGSPILGTLQARTLEWVAISFSNAWKWKGKVKSLSRVRLLATPWLQPTRLLHPWDFPGKSTGVGCHCLLCSIGLLEHKQNEKKKRIRATQVR